MNTTAPLILAITSGKGGVGKTMLTVACAHELSRVRRTLLVDLDFFNRGLSGLFRERPAANGDGQPPPSVARPDFVAREKCASSGDAAAAEAGPWEVWEVAPQLFHLAYPATTNDEDDALEIGADLPRPARVAVLARQLEAWLLALARDLDCSCLVLDCHGGPDLISFAAAQIADHTLLVSEPDRITLHGTLNFLHKLWRVCGDEAPDVRLVFNKVAPEIRPTFLQKHYDQSLKKEFFGEELLAVFPLEDYLAKAFETAPILSALYPYSLLARKIQVLLSDLLGKERPELLAPAARSLPGWVKNHRRRTTGRLPKLLDHNYLLGFVSVLAVLMILLSGLASSIRGAREEETRAARTIALIASLINERLDVLNRGAYTAPFAPESSYDREKFADFITKGTPLSKAGIFATSDAQLLWHYHVESFATKKPWRPDMFDADWRLPDTDVATLNTNILPNIEKYPQPDANEFPTYWQDSMVVLKRIPRWHSWVFAANLWWAESYVRASAWLGWVLATVFILYWSRGLDRLFTQALRSRRLGVAAGYWLVSAALWVLVLLGIGACIAYLGQQRGIEAFQYSVSAQKGAWSLVGPAALWLAALGNLAYLVRRLIKYERQRLEVAFRIAFLLYLLAGGAFSVWARTWKEPGDIPVSDQTFGSLPISSHSIAAALDKNPFSGSFGGRVGEKYTVPDNFGGGVAKRSLFSARSDGGVIKE